MKEPRNHLLAERSGAAVEPLQVDAPPLGRRGGTRPHRQSLYRHHAWGFGRLVVPRIRLRSRRRQAPGAARQSLHRQRQAIRQHRDALIALIQRRGQRAVRWRVEAMSKQVALGQVLPLLVAHRHIAVTPDACVSCGDSLTGPVPVVGVGRCAVCRRAVWIITNNVGDDQGAAVRTSGSVVPAGPHCSA